MKEEHQIKQRLHFYYKELSNLTMAEYGSNSWSNLRGFINALEWVLYSEVYD